MLLSAEPFQVMVVSYPMEASICSLVSKPSVPVMKMHDNALKNRPVHLIGFLFGVNIQFYFRKYLKLSRAELAVFLLLRILFGSFV